LKAEFTDKNKYQPSHVRDELGQVIQNNKKT